MKADKPVKVIQTKRRPPIWTVKVGARYITGFVGEDAKARATVFAAKISPEFQVVEKPTPKREQSRLDAIAALSDPT
jgi:hypothetical protein